MKETKLKRYKVTDDPTFPVQVPISASVLHYLLLCLSQKQFSDGSIKRKLAHLLHSQVYPF
jgi:hypothetical protein